MNIYVAILQISSEFYEDKIFMTLLIQLFVVNVLCIVTFSSAH